MISFVKIEGFKSIRNLSDFRLRNLNVLIGPNRSGKSNFLDFWDLISSAGKEQLPQAINRRGGIVDVLSWEQNLPLNFELNFDAVDDFEEYGGISYSAEIVSRRLSYVILKELFIKTPARGQPLSGTSFDGDRSLPPGYNWLYDELIKQGHQIDTNNLAIAQIRDTVDYPVHDKLRRYLSNILVHRPFNTEENAPIRNPQPLGAREADAPPTRLNRGGDNLSNVLYHLQNEPKYQDYYNEFLLTLQRAFPSLERLVFRAEGGQGKTILSWQDRHFNKYPITANLLSDGTLRFMCLLAALYDPEPPSLLCIDEPEVGLHPQQLRLLASVIQEASERVQILVTTHSSDLISFLQNVEDVVVVEAEDGWSKLRRLDPKELQHWLGEYSLGELWRSGEIGGRS